MDNATFFCGLRYIQATSPVARIELVEFLKKRNESYL
jgi:hypothetical protein